MSQANVQYRKVPLSRKLNTTVSINYNCTLKSNYTLAELLQFIIALSFMADSPVGTGVTLLSLIEVNSIAQHPLMSSRQLS